MAYRETLPRKHGSSPGLGYAPEYVKAMWLMLQQEKPDDFVIGTGESHSVKDFLDLSFACVDLDWRNYVEIDPLYYRPPRSITLLRKLAKREKQLQWHHGLKFPELVASCTGQLEAYSERTNSRSPNENRRSPHDHSRFGLRSKVLLLVIQVRTHVRNQDVPLPPETEFHRILGDSMRMAIILDQLFDMARERAGCAVYL